MLEKYVAKWGDKMFEDDMAKIVRNHALIAAVVMMIPLLGMGIFIFIGILWHMYSELCKKCGTELKLSSVIVGIIVNVLIAFVVNLVFGLVPVFGWFGTGFIVFVQFYLSGKSFIEILKGMDL